MVILNLYREIHHDRLMVYNRRGGALTKVVTSTKKFSDTVYPN